MTRLRNILLALLLVAVPSYGLKPFGPGGHEYGSMGGYMAARALPLVQVQIPSDETSLTDPYAKWQMKIVRADFGAGGELLGFWKAPQASTSTTTVDLTTTGSNQTWTKAVDWNDFDNTVECYAGGGFGGGWCNDNNCGGNGGGGGAYAKSVNLNLSSQTSAVYRVGATSTNGTTSCAASGGTCRNGGAGNDSWFNNSSFPASGPACGAKGSAGNSAGGLASGSYATGTGSATNNGGTGGSGAGSGCGVGGGGGGGGGSTGAGGTGGTGSGTSGGTSGSAGGGLASAGGAGGGCGGNGGSPAAAGGGGGGAGDNNASSGGTPGVGARGQIRLSYRALVY